MFTTSSNIPNNTFHLDFKKTYFPHPVLDNCSGERTIIGILRVTKQLKQDAASVPNTLGGGQHGYLVLILTTDQWKSISSTVPFIKPANPGVFTTSVTTNAEITIEKSTWEDNVRRYNEYQLLESTLKNTCVSAFDSEYFDGICYSITNAVERPIAEIIQYLYNEYGEMTLEQMMDKEEETKRYVFDPVQPISTVFNAITAYKNLCELSGESITNITMVKLGYTIMNRSRVFKDSLI